MAHVDIIRAWKDEEYRLSLSEAQQALLPAHPAGLIELTDADLAMIAGGRNMLSIASNDASSGEASGLCISSVHLEC